MSATNLVDSWCTNGRTYRALARLNGRAFDRGEPYLAWVNEGERVVAIVADLFDRGYWLATADGAEVLVDGDPMSLLVTDEEWQADLAADLAEVA